MENEKVGESAGVNVAEDVSVLQLEEQEEDLLWDLFNSDDRKDDTQAVSETLALQTTGRLRVKIRQLLRSTQPASEAVPWARENKIRLTGSGGILQEIATFPMLGEIRRLLPSCVLHPQVAIFLDLIEKEPGFMPARSGESKQDSLAVQAECMNRILTKFRERASTKATLREVVRWEARSSRNYQGLKDYLNYLIDYYKRVLVVRLDLHLKRNDPDSHNPIMLKAYLDKLLRNRRSKPSLFEHLVGYAWRLEHTESRGCHFHFILVFDSQSVRQGISYADMIGEYWRDVITEGKGTYWNCNKQAYRRYGVGVISHRDEEKRLTFIRDVAFYLAKVGEYYSLKKPEGHAKLKCFGKGELPSLVGHKGPGRPRSFEKKDIG